MKFMPIMRDLLPNNHNIHLPKTRTSFGIFNISYQGPKICNYLDESEKNYLISN